MAMATTTRPASAVPAQKKSQTDLDAEIFQEVAVDPRYEISNLGRIRNKRTDRILKPFLHEGGYWRIRLGSQLRYIHVLVAQAFIPRDPNPDRVVVDHIDGDKDNFKWDNLRWLTRAENSQAHYELTSKALKLIMRTRDGAVVWQFPSAAHCIKAFPELRLSAHGISMACRGDTKTHRQHIFEYVGGGRVRTTPRPLHADELFRTVGTFEGHDLSNYEISNYGLLRNIRGMYLTQTMDSGYICYTLQQNNVRVEIRAHRLVAHAFCSGRLPARHVVNHKDKNRQNNHDSNLEWCTPQENAVHGTGKAVEQLTLDGQVVGVYDSMSAAAVAIGCGSGEISCCCSGKRKTARGFKWRLMKES